MGYTVEVSYNLEQCDNVTQINGFVVEEANKCNALSHYQQHEMSGNVKKPRRHCIITVIFNEEDVLLCAKFLRIMKQTKHIHVECIYTDSVRCNILYASPYYIQNMEKHNADEYKKRNKDRSNSMTDNEEILINSIPRKPRAHTLDTIPTIPSSVFKELPESSQTTGTSGTPLFSRPNTT